MVAVHLHAHPSRGELARSDRVGVQAETGEVQHHSADHDDHEGDDRDGGDRAEHVAVADGGGQHGGHLTDVDAAGEDLREAERHAQRAERDDQRRDLRLRDEEPVEQSPADAAGDRDEDADHGRAPARPPMARMTMAETTPENTSTEPIDRSMPAVMIT